MIITKRKGEFWEEIRKGITKPSKRNCVEFLLKYLFSCVFQVLAPRGSSIDAPPGPPQAVLGTLCLLKQLIYIGFLFLTFFSFFSLLSLPLNCIPPRKCVLPHSFNPRYHKRCKYEEDLWIKLMIIRMSRSGGFAIITCHDGYN